MGYTHYWERPPRLPTQPFGRAVADCRQLLPQLNVPLAGPNGTGAPVCRPDAIVFNGVGAAMCETFAIRLEEEARPCPWLGEDPGTGQPVRSFCKTERRPYDLAVQAALIVLRHHLGKQFHVTSDGDEAEWATARRLCQQHLSYGGDFRLDKG